LFVEVHHGPFLVDNNLFLSPKTLLTASQGGAFVHNLIAGGLTVLPFDGRLTPFHEPHSTKIAGLHDNPVGDVRFYNNLFVNHGDLSLYDGAKLPVWMDGNIFLKDTKPSKHETNPLLKPDFDPEVKLAEMDGGLFLQMKFDHKWATEQTRKCVTTRLLGKAVISDLRFEHVDGTPYRFNKDYFGNSRSKKNPTPGPFENPGQGEVRLKVW
jgi:alpha-L-arabinofuranosidase